MNIYWFVLPLTVAVSLVYAATRHEAWPEIWSHAARLCGTILAILIVTTLLLLWLNTQIVG